MSYEVKARYTGTFPNYCRGQWIIEITNPQTEESNVLQFKNNLNIKGTYQTWNFDENYLEEWSTYESGLELDEWIENLPENLQTELFKYRYDLKDKELLTEIYNACKSLDWRSLSCGGCI